MGTTFGPAGVDRRIATRAAGQHGVIGHDQVLRLGLGNSAISHRLVAGRLHTVHAGVYAVGHPVLTTKGRWMAAVLAGGPGAALSHQDGAALHAFRRDAGAKIHVTVPDRSGRRRPGIVFHRPRTLPEDEVTVVDGIPVTTPERTLLDLAEVVSRRQLERACDEAERLRAVDWSRAAELVERHPGKLGARRLRRVLLAHAIGDRRTRSELEERFLALCRRHGIPRPDVNTVVAGSEVDVAWRGARLVVEIDGDEWHRTAVARERDRRRDAALVADGWRVLRLGEGRLLTDGPRIAGELRSVLGAACGAPPGSGAPARPPAAPVP